MCVCVCVCVTERHRAVRLNHISADHRQKARAHLGLTVCPLAVSVITAVAAVVCVCCLLLVENRAYTIMTDTVSDLVPTENGTQLAEGDPPADTSPPEPEMRALSLLGFGGIRMIKVAKTPESKPKEGEVLIRVKAW